MQPALDSINIFRVIKRSNEGVCLKVAAWIGEHELFGNVVASVGIGSVEAQRQIVLPVTIGRVSVAGRRRCVSHPRRRHDASPFIGSLVFFSVFN